MGMKTKNTENRTQSIDNTTVVEVEKGIKIIPGANTIITNLDKVVNWGRKIQSGP